MTGGARRAKELSEQFIKNGHSVTVFTAYPRDFRSMPGFRAKKYEVLNSVVVIRCNTIFNVAKNPIFRMLSYFIYVIHSFIYISQKLIFNLNIFQLFLLFWQHLLFLHIAVILLEC